MQKFTDLRVWQAARILSVAVYKATKSFPTDERYGLSSQLRRATVSILANIAEGAKRAHPAEYAQFSNIAEASLAELQCLLILCADLGYLRRSQEELQVECDRIAVMLNALRRSVIAAPKTSRR